jgi:hypothetical protein
MQTFLPYPNFLDSVKALDYRRLGKQRVEADQILNTIKFGGGWIHHPIMKMWKGFEDALIMYRNYCILEWIERGYKNNMLLIPIPSGDIAMPSWMGDKAFHMSHQSNLLRKFPAYYSQFNWNVPDHLPYIWQ